MEKTKKEILVRLNSRITERQQTYIRKIVAENKKKGRPDQKEGEVLRSIINKVMLKSK